MGKDVFENAIVDTNILLVRRGQSDAICKAVDMDRLPNKAFPPEESLWMPFTPQADKPWSLLSPTEQSIRRKMQTIGTPLKQWDISIYRGVTTGYNAAFIIDNATKERLVKEDPKSADIIKPILRGRDVRRWRAQWVKLWLIDTHNGYGKVPAINIDDYPAVKKWLDKFYPQLAKRQDQGQTPYNLRHCAYHQLFLKEKLVWITLVENGRFSYDGEGFYCEASTFIMTGEYVKYLCAVLNAKLIRWFLQQVAPTSGMGVFQWKKVYVETIPIPKIPEEAQRPFIELVDRILKIKTASPAADTSKLESNIDRLVYQLYKLTESEIAAIEEASK